MLYGKLPKAKSPDKERGVQEANFSEMIKTINSGQSSDSISLCSPADDLLSKLLEVNPALRLGSGDDDIKRIKEHEFFSDIDWKLLLKKKLDPPFVPELANDHDTR